MHFAYPLPWWLAILLVAVAAGFALIEYRRPIVPLSPARRWTLALLRAVVVLALLAFVFRPMLLLPPSGNRDAVVPVILDVSRSMRLHDADGQTRLARATTILKTQLLPALRSHFKPEVFAAGDQVTPASPDGFAAEARHTRIADAIADVRERYRGQRIAGLIVLSDGGETQKSAAPAAAAAGAPVFAIGVGSADAVHDREIVGITAGDPRLDQAAVDLHVTAVSSGFGRTPYQVRLLANGRLIDSRRIVPAADGAPVEEVFAVSPDPLIPTVYTAEIPEDDSEVAAENNQRSILVSPAGRKRRLLFVEGAPGFEHSFLTRALSHDPNFETDAVVRKGKNGDGQDTFFVQAAAARTTALLAGFPTKREELFAYDGLVIANVEGDFFSRAQLALAADFVSERGGGLLVLGARSFSQRGLSGTPLEDALPVELSDRRGGLVRAAYERPESGGAPHNKLVVTPDGENHPMMRIGGSVEESHKLWNALPPLASSAPLGGPRPGATVLAVTAVPGGNLYPVVAVQRYGLGRSMIFAGEASWRWRMMIPSTDHSYEFFWRQAARWLTGAAPDPVAVSVSGDLEPGESAAVEVVARDRAFAPAAGASVEATVTAPNGTAQPMKLRASGDGRFASALAVPAQGLYHVAVEASRGSSQLGTAERWFYVGGADREFADPRLNEGFLRRLARSSGGRYARAADAPRVVDWLKDAVPQSAAPERRDLWHQPWAFALIVALLGAEWILRRAWGLR